MFLFVVNKLMPRTGQTPCVRLGRNIGPKKKSWITIFIILSTVSPFLQKWNKNVTMWQLLELSPWATKLSLDLSFFSAKFLHRVMVCITFVPALVILGVNVIIQSQQIIVLPGPSLQSTGSHADASQVHLELFCARCWVPWPLIRQFAPGVDGGLGSSAD